MVFLAISIPLFERHTVLAVYHEVAKPAGRGILLFANQHFWPLAATNFPCWSDTRKEDGRRRKIIDFSQKY